MLEQLLNQQSLYVWAKDPNYRYIYVNENYAAAAGVESPHQMIGKTDDEMPWKHLAAEFQRGDHDVIQSGIGRLNSVEKSSTVNGITDILVSETPYIDSTGKIIGVKGSFLDITGRKLIQKPGFYDAENDRYYLGVVDLGDIYFTGREMEVFKLLMHGMSASQIAKRIGLSRKTVETYIVYIRRKFGAETKVELITMAMQYGLTHLI